MLPTVYMLVGIPGSGKTSYAQKLAKEKVCPIISTDAIRNLHPDWDETLIWPETYRICAEILSRGEDLIFDATNTTPNVRKRFKEKLEPYKLSYQIAAYFFPTPWEICYERIEKRNKMAGERYFPLDKVKSYADTIIAPSLDEGFIYIEEISIDKQKEG
ncbi:ATP-binding protein [bacterium]|nr:ATP-binding protein [bacterium]